MDFGVEGNVVNPMGGEGTEESEEAERVEFEAVEKGGRERVIELQWRTSRMVKELCGRLTAQ